MRLEQKDAATMTSKHRLNSSKQSVKLLTKCIFMFTRILLYKHAGALKRSKRRSPISPPLSRFPSSRITNNTHMYTLYTYDSFYTRYYYSSFFLYHSYKIDHLAQNESPFLFFSFNLSPS